ncbi:MAG: MAPEG family protein [Rhizobiaceae bacterium]|nr:MAPEG family protein [Rhizobiaceae bacterium]
MTGYEMFWPLVAHAVLVYILYGLLGLRRRAVTKAGKIDPSKFRENHAADEPAESLVVRNNIANQFELPVLFYACSIVLFVTQADNLPAVILAWIFVISRYAHSYVHVTSNNLRYRSPLFALGYIALAGMWAWLLVWMIFS